MSDYSTHAFDVPLKPCPFCGGEAELTGFNAPEYWVWCPSCKASTDAHTGKENAIAAWNTRAERTCRMEYQTEGMQRGWWKCSECGGAMDTIDACAGRKPPKWCGNCGARVVE